MMMSLGGTKPPDSEILRSYCNDLTREEADQVLTRYVPESLMLYTQSADCELPAGIPKFYVKLSKDKCLSDSLQMRMIRHMDADRIVTIDAGHLAMISEPKKIADLLNSWFDHSAKPKSGKSLSPVYR